MKDYMVLACFVGLGAFAVLTAWLTSEESVLEGKR